MKNNIYFDVCGTLFNVNTTFHFIHWYHIRKNNKIKALYCRFLLSVFGKALNRFFKMSLRKSFFATVKGESRSVLYTLADEYIDVLLHHHKIKGIFEIFERLVTNESDNVILISASIDPIINMLSERFGLECHSSQLAYEQDKFIGEFYYDLKGDKQKIVKDKDNNYAFYSDNLDDLPCAHFVDDYVYVVKKGKKSRDDLITSDNVRIVYV